MAKLGITDLSTEQLNEVLSSVPERGAYDRELREFVESGSAGREISLTEGRFANRKAQSVKTGFEQAVKRTSEPGKELEGAQDVVVKVWQDRVFIINDRLAREAAATEE